MRHSVSFYAAASVERLTLSAGRQQCRPAFILLFLAASIAHANSDTTKNDAEGLQEIVVTAQKREQNIQDVPISVTAVAGERLDALGTYDFRDLLLTIPGLSYSGTEPGQSNYSIRGVSTGASSPTTGIYLDDVSLITIATFFSGAVDLPMFDLARIEVMKGPQGTLYGGSAMGGAIKYVTNKPDLTELQVSSSAGAESTQGGAMSYNAGGVLNVPLVDDKLAMRVGVSYRNDGGYIDYVPGAQGIWPNRGAAAPPAPFAPLAFDSSGGVAQRNANNIQELGARAALRFELDSGITILPEATVQRNYEAEPPYFWMNLPGLQVAARMPQPTHDDLDIYSMTVGQRLGPVTLTSLSAYSDRSRVWDRDYTYWVAGLYPELLSHDSPSSSVTNTTKSSEELRLASSDPVASVKWVGGFLYENQYDALRQVIETDGSAAIFGSGTDVTYTGTQLTRTIQLAGFADVTYSLSKRWDVGVGLRRFNIDQTYNSSFSGVINGGPTAVKNEHSSDVGLNPKYAITYHPADGHLLYASASKGFRAGGVNRYDTSSSLCAPDFSQLDIPSAPRSYKSDSLWTYEIGNKNAFGEGRFLLDTAIYYTRWKDIQQQVNLPSCGFQFIGNVGAAQIKGAESELQAVVAKPVTIGAGISYSKSEVTATAPGISAQIGQPLLDTPEWTGNAYIELQLHMTWGWASKLRLDYEYHGANIRQFESTAVITYPNGSSGTIPDPVQVQHAYDVANIGIESRKGPYGLRLYVQNIGNSRPILDNTARLYDTPNVTTLRPRTIGLEVRQGL